MGTSHSDQILFRPLTLVSCSRTVTMVPAISIDTDTINTWRGSIRQGLVTFVNILFTVDTSPTYNRFFSLFKAFFYHIDALTKNLKAWLMVSNHRFKQWFDVKQVAGPLINSLRPSDAYMHQQHIKSLVQIMVCCLFGAEPLSEPMLGTSFNGILIEIQTFSLKKMHLETSSVK